MKILVAGNSYVGDAAWIRDIFPRCSSVINVAEPAAGNQFITTSVQYHAIQHAPDFVFMILSGINRLDLRLPNHEFFQNPRRFLYTQLGNSIWYHGHGRYEVSPRMQGTPMSDSLPGQQWLAMYQNMRQPDWPEVSNIHEWFALPDDIKRQCINNTVDVVNKQGWQNIDGFAQNYHLMRTVVHHKPWLSEINFQALMNCCNFLDRKKIPWRFCFGTDPWNNHPTFAHRSAVEEMFYHEIDWQRYIHLPCYEWGAGQGFLEEDGHHLTAKGMQLWAKQVRAILQTQSDLKHFFKSKQKSKKSI